MADRLRFVLRAEGPRYLALVEAIERQIAGGRLRPGDRMPAQRHIAAELGLNLTTVTRAYSEAIRRGLLLGEVGRGTFVRARAAERDFADPATQAIDLSVNHPPASLIELATEALRQSLDELSVNSDLSALCNYGDSRGRLAHREAGTAWAAARGVTAGAERVVVTSGTQHAILATLLALGKRGGVVLAEALTYPGLKAVAEQLDISVRGVALDDDGMVPESLREVSESTRAQVLYTMPNVHNPTSTIMPSARREAIAAIVRERGLIVIEDDCYGALVATGGASLTSVIPERCYFLTGLSKTVLPALRIGHVIAPTGRDAQRVAAAVAATTWMASPLMAEVAARWVSDGTAERLVKHVRADLKARFGIVQTTFAASSCNTNQFSPHTWLKLPLEWSAAEFVVAARTQGVIVAPAEAFSVTTSTPPAVRLSTSSPRTHAELADALNTLHALLQTNPPALL